VTLLTGSLSLINFSTEKAYKTQIMLSKKVIREDKLPNELRYIAGVDVAYTNELSIGAVAVFEYKSLRLVECQTSVLRTVFPYIPTLLSFREVPPSISCIKRLKTSPDVILVNGHGLAHPRRCGFACHLGVVLKKPAIGIAKNKLVGEIEDFKGRDFAYIWHSGEIVGVALMPAPRVKPIYVSIGNMVSLETAINIVRRCLQNSRLPEPLKAAHNVASQAKKLLENAKTD